jgi:hypothetical protein
MIRNVTMGRLHPGADMQQLDEGLKGLRALLDGDRIAGLIGLDCGRDAGLREGNWDYAVTADLLDEAAYRRYDEDEEHNRIRRELLGPVSQQIVRVQFVMG